MFQGTWGRELDLPRLEARISAAPIRNLGPASDRLRPAVPKEPPRFGQEPGLMLILVRRVLVPYSRPGCCSLRPMCGQLKLCS